MLQIRITGRIDKIADGREVTRRTVHYLDENGVEMFKTDVPTAERIARAASNDDTTMAEFGTLLNAQINKLPATERKRKTVASQEVVLVAE